MRASIRVAMACLAGWAAAAWGQSARPGWGAVPYAGGSETGVAFRVWAPEASSVTVAGTFNGWSMTATPLVLESATSGVWSADVAPARPGDEYKYVMNGALWRSDPRSRWIDSQGHGNSPVPATNGFEWGGDTVGIPDPRDLVIYEAHVGTLAGPAGGFESFAGRLDDLAGLGVSAIELMPVNEYPSATSWGYNPAYPFALEADYGSPDAFRNLVRSAHERGIRVLLDVVHNHWDRNSSLWKLDTTNHPGPYFYGAAPYADTRWGPRPDYGRSEVREYIFDSFRMWLEEYHVDGFRWDTPKHMVFTTNGIFITNGWTLVAEALDRMATGYTGIVNIAENSREYFEDFDSAWDVTFCGKIRGVLTKGSDSERDMNVVASNLAGTANRILYTDSHDTAGDLNNGVRLPVAIQGGDPEGYYARKRSALGAALVFTAPGTPMILQGQEMLETNAFCDARPVDWTRTNLQAGTWRLYRDLIRLRRNLDGVSAGLRGEVIQVYPVDNANKLIAYGRQDGAGTGGTVAVVANFSNVARTGYVARFPAAGMWYTVFNSDSTNYAADYGGWGSLEVSAEGEPALGRVDIGPYDVLVFAREPLTGMLPAGGESIDQPGGNGDGRLDPGETVREWVVLWNKSDEPATNVSAILTAMSPGVTVVRGESAYDPMEPGGRATNRTDFLYRVDPALACGEELAFQIVAAFNGRTQTHVFRHAVGSWNPLPSQTNEFGVWTPLPIPDGATVYSELGIEESGEPVIEDVDVWIQIDHPYDWDLTLALQHPDGTEVVLANQRGGAGAGFGTGECGSAVYTVLDQSAAESIAGGVAPFAGSFRPETTLEVFNGKPLNGVWRLRMTDASAPDSGTNLCWGVRAVHASRMAACEVFSNHVPVALATSLWLAASGGVDVVLQGSDVDGQPLEFLADEAPRHGIWTGPSRFTGEASYHPVYGFAGTDSCTFAVSDGFATSEAARVEFRMPPGEDANTNGLLDGWELRHWTNLVDALPGVDHDNDGMTNLDESRANTDPWKPDSVLRMVASPAVLRWSSVGGVRYRVEWTEDLAGGVFQPVERPVADEMDPAAVGEASVQEFMDGFLEGSMTNGGRMRAYRVRVLNE